jgi:uncharacterized protein (TIGR02117 family)
VYVAGHSWHAGLVIPIRRVPEAIWPEAGKLDAHRFVEIGWGDAAYYQAEDPSLGLKLLAGFCPTPSVMRLELFDDEVVDYFPASDVIEIAVSRRGFRRMCAFVSDSVWRSERGAWQVTQHGRFGRSFFVRSDELYCLPRTCNTWVARALRAAGCPVAPARACRSDDLIGQCARFGTTLQRRREP